MADKENSTSQETDASSKPPVKADGGGKGINALPKALPVVEGKGEKPTIQPGETQKVPEKKAVTPEQQKRLQAKDEATKKYATQKEQLEKTRELIQTGENLSGAFSLGASTFEQGKPLMEISVQNAEKQFSESLASKHTIEIAAIVGGEELTKIGSEAHEKAYRGMLEGRITETVIPDFNTKKEEVKKQLAGQDEAFKKLSPDEQDKRVREQVVENQTVACIQAVEIFRALSPEDKKKPENLQKLQDVSGGKLDMGDLLQDEKVKDQIIKNIQEKGMMESGIDISSPIGKTLVDLARTDYETYVSQMSEKSSLDDLPMNIRQNLFWNKDFLGADQDVPSKLSRDIQVVKNQLQVREGEDEIQRNKRMDEAFKSTGVSRESVEKGARKFDMQNMSPFIRFLADLLAPIGAMMGGKSGEFWRQYMQESGGNPLGDSDSPLSNGSRGLEGGTIDAKYSADHEKNVKEYIAKGADPAYQNKISSTAQNIERYQGRYQAVSDALKQKGKNIPWEVIGAIHEREGSLNFNTCLHNGDPLNRVTTHVPKGLGPFSSWESAAIDALSRETYIDGMDTTTVSGLARVAEFSERFNGLGYRNKKRTSPYVWAGAPFYTGGRYVADGVYSSISKDSRPGTMPVVMELAKKRPNFAGFAENNPNVAKNDDKGDPSKEIFSSNSPIAFIGDSHMNFLTNGLGYNPYGKDKKLPGKNTVEIPTVMSGGNMGDKGYSILNQINSTAGQEYIKSKNNVVICLGTNDATMFSSETMATNMRTIVEKVQAIHPDKEKTKITIVTPPRNALPEVNQKVEQYIAGLNQNAFNANVRIADFYAYSQEKHLSMQDKDHLSTSSYNEMKKYIQKIISEQ